MGQLGHCCPRWVESCGIDSGLRGQPLHCVNGRRAGNYLDPCGLDLFGGLRPIAAIGKQPRRPPGNGQCGAGACKGREVAEIGKVCNDEPREPGSAELAAQSTDAAEVVHGGKDNAMGQPRGARE